MITPCSGGDHSHLFTFINLSKFGGYRGEVCGFYFVIFGHGIIFCFGSKDYWDNNYPAFAGG
jgi:hypothetical protein